jgi:hypothetical protein
MRRSKGEELAGKERMRDKLRIPRCLGSFHFLFRGLEGEWREGRTLVGGEGGGGHAAVSWIDDRLGCAGLGAGMEVGIVDEGRVIIFIYEES